MKRLLSVPLSIGICLIAAAPAAAQTPGSPPGGVTAVGMPGGLSTSAGIGLPSLSSPVPGPAGVGTNSTTPTGSAAPPLCQPGQNATGLTAAAPTLDLQLKTGAGQPDYSSLGKTAAGFVVPTSYNGYPVAFSNGAVTTTTWTTAVDPQTIATNQMAIPATMQFTYDCVNGQVKNGKYIINVQQQPIVIAPALPAVPPPPAFNVTGTADNIVLGWQKGQAKTSPGAATYVHIPTCAWVEGAAAPPVGDWGNLFAVQSPNPSGGNDWVEYEVVISVSAGPIVFSWGDAGTPPDPTGGGKDVANSLDGPPTGAPQYDPIGGVFPDAVAFNPCNVDSVGYHRYSTIAPTASTSPQGRHITATKTFSVHAEWYYDIGAGPVDGGALPCAGCNSIPVTWDFGWHHVDQIQGVPYFPPPG